MAQRIVKWFATWNDILQYLDDVEKECIKHEVSFIEDIVLVDLELPKESTVDSLQYKVILYI